jgi:uncharacterized protein YkwD
MLASTRARAQPAPCAPDDHLSAAAAELLLSAQTAPNPQQLTAAVRAANSDAVALHALFSAAGSGSDAERVWLEQQRQRADVALRCGSAQSERGQLLIVSAEAAELQPIEPGTRVIRGQLAQGFERAELIIASADGQLVRLGVPRAELVKGVTIDETLPWPWHVQLIAHGPAGPRPVAERWVAAVAGQMAEAQTQALSAAVTDSAAPADLAHLIGELRVLRRRPRLRDNRLLREAATSHARAVCAEGRIAHALTPGSGPSERVARAGLSSRLVGEAIARAESPSAAFAALQRSPSHLLTLLERRFTDYGVGVASDPRGKQCFVVLLSAWPKAM